nr:hypothetical protein [Tanacetum cinerariifolium]
MVNTHTDAELAAAIRNALQTLLLQIREEFRNGFGPSGFGGNPPPVTIHTWLERFNKQKPRSFEKATAPFEGDALAWWKAYKQAKCGDVWLITVTCAEFKELFFLQFFPRADQERLKMEYHSIRQTDTEISTEFIQHFCRLVGFLRAATGTAEEQAKNLQLPMLLATMRSSMRGMMLALSDQTRGRRVVIGSSRPLNKVVTGTTVIIMTIMDQTRVSVMGVTRETGVSSPTDLSILKSGDRHQPTSQQSSHMSHGHHNDRHGSDRRGGSDNHRSSNNNYSGSNNRNSGNGRDQRNRGHQSNRSANSVYKLLQGDGWCVPNIPSHGADLSTHVTIRGLPSTACEATPLFTMHYTLQHDTL